MNLLADECFESLKPKIATWRLLSEHSSLMLHLNFVALLGSTAATNLTVQKFCLTNIVQNPKVIFQLMMIDKHEIRRAYLLLLRGIWFSNLPNSPSASEMLTSDYKNYMLALFDTFAQDTRLFAFMKAESAKIVATNGDGGKGGAGGAGGVQEGSATIAVSTGNTLEIDRGAARTSSQKITAHTTVLENYIIDALLPFVAFCADTKLLQILDDVNFNTENRHNSSAYGRGSQRARKSGRTGPLQGLLKGPHGGKEPEIHCTKLLEDFFVEIALALADGICGHADPYDAAARDSVLQTLIRHPAAFQAAKSILSRALNDYPAAVSRSPRRSSLIARMRGATHADDGAMKQRPPSMSSRVGTASSSTAVTAAAADLRKEYGNEIPTEIETSLKLALERMAANERFVLVNSINDSDAAADNEGNGSKPSVSHGLFNENPNLLEAEEKEQILKFNCLQEFIPTVDKFIQSYSQRLDHLIFLKAPRFLYIGDREFPNDPEVLEDPTNSAGQGNLTKVDAVLNPLNSRFFKYTMQEMSKFVVSYARYNDPEGYDGIISQMQEVDNNREIEFKKISESDIILPDCHLDKDVSEMLSGMKQGKAELRNRKKSPSEVFSEAQFRRWSQHGGLLLRLLLEHILHSLACFQGLEFMDRSSFSLDDISPCNSYWLNTLIKGVLHSNIAELFDLYSDQTETQIAQVAIETSRMMYMQNTLSSIGAHQVLVKMLGVSEDKLRGFINADSIHIIRRMGIDFGISLTELGNANLQNAIIATIDEEYRRNLSLGIGEHFMLSLRLLLQRFSHDFSSTDELDPIRISQVRKLLTFISLLCEGHNDKSQEYLGRFSVVLEVASFVHDMSRLLATEMKKCMISPSEEEFPIKHWPTVLGQYRRPLIRWVAPLPVSAEDYRNTTGTGSSSDVDSFAKSGGRAGFHKHSSSRVHVRDDYTFIDIDRLSLLCELVQAGYEALAEFCQRPCFANQVAIVRAGCTRDFHTFFEFFGAFQLVNKIDPSSHDTDTRRKAFAKRFNKEIGTYLTHEAVHPMPNTHRRLWIGNDPLALQLTIEETLTVAHGHPPVTEHLVARRKHAKRDNGGCCLSLLRPITNLFCCMRDSPILPDTDRHMNLADMDDWKTEKAHFAAYIDGKTGNAPGIEKNYYFKIRAFSNVVSDLEASCIKFTGSLLEGSVMDDDKEVPRIVMESLGEENLISNMANYWERYLTYGPLTATVSKEESYEWKMAFAYYALAMRITDMNTLDNSVLAKVRHWLDKSELFMDSRIARIEVRSPEVDKPHSLVVTYFPIPSVIHRYWNTGEILERRDKILFPSKLGSRDSADEKVKSFIAEGRILLANLRHLESLDEIWAPKNFIFRFLVAVAHHMKHWSNLSFALTVTINICLVISVKTGDNNKGYEVEGSFIPQFGIGWHQFIDVLLWIQLSMVSLMLFSYSVMHGWLYVKLDVRDNPTNEFTLNGYVLSRCGYVLNRLWLLGKTRAQLKGNSLTFNLWESTSRLIYFIGRSETIYYSFLLLSVIAAIFHNRLWIVINLVEILRLSKLMQYVTRAFTENINQVAVTVLLAAVLLYMFTAVGYSTDSIRNNYYFDDAGDNTCDSLQSCFRLHLDYGMLQAMFWHYPGYIASVEGEIFNFAFTFIMQIVIPGLISGIIIDTFSEMRGNKQAVEEDVANTCFICNVDREDFESVNVSFDHHVKEDHNMWKYLWFMIYLEELDPTEFDGIQQFCYDMIKQDGNSTRWLPIKMARCLSQLRDKYDLFTIFSKVTTLQNQVERIQPNLSKVIKDRIKDLSGTVNAAMKKISKQQQQHLRNRDLGTPAGAPRYFPPHILAGTTAGLAPAGVQPMAANFNFDATASEPSGTPVMGTPRGEGGNGTGAGAGPSSAAADALNEAASEV